MSNQVLQELHRTLHGTLGSLCSFVNLRWTREDSSTAGTAGDGANTDVDCSGGVREKHVIELVKFMGSIWIQGVKCEGNLATWP